MCCGSNRAAARAAAMAARASTIAIGDRRTGTTDIVFEYLGREGADIHGPASGRMYRFERPGARVHVDPRDRPGLAALSVLRWIR